MDFFGFDEDGDGFRLPTDDPFSTMASAIGDATWSGLSLEDVWASCLVSEGADDFGAAVHAVLLLRVMGVPASPRGAHGPLRT